ARQATLLDRDGGVGFVYCDIVEVDQDGERIGRDYSVGRERRTLSGDITPSLLMGGYFPPHTVMVRRTALAEVGGFDPALGGNADLDLWLRLASNGFTAAYVDEKLVDYRRQPQGMSRDLGHMLDTRARTFAKIAVRRPESVAAALVDLQQVSEDIHAANQ